MGLTASELAQEGSSHVTSSKVGACSCSRAPLASKVGSKLSCQHQSIKLIQESQYSALILNDLDVFLSLKASSQVSWKPSSEVLFSPIFLVNVLCFLNEWILVEKTDYEFLKFYFILFLLVPGINRLWPSTEKPFNWTGFFFSWVMLRCCSDDLMLI